MHPCRSTFCGLVAQGKEASYHIAPVWRPPADFESNEEASLSSICWSAGGYSYGYLAMAVAALPALWQIKFESSMGALTR
ncbi:TPA: hypothetical protein ACH3X3_011802 [Trebouxia sp. C0006]